LDFTTIKTLIQPAFTIALLAGIESLLSAVVADGMIGGNHKSNMELIAQGTANIFSAVFGGIPATGAIARTATNVKNGGLRLWLECTCYFLYSLCSSSAGGRLIFPWPPAGILLVVAYNMSEWQNFASMLKSSGAMLRFDDDILLTVLVDLTVTIEIGMVLAVFLFMRNMIKFSDVSIITKDFEQQ
jgi:SulP family sulfate permease